MRTGEQLLNAIQCGRRGGQMRYFTYVLLPDKINFSETGGGTDCSAIANVVQCAAMHLCCSAADTIRTSSLMPS